MERRCVPAMASTKSSWYVLRITVPGKAKRDGGMGISAVVVVEAADEEVCPLGDASGACDAAGVGAKEVGLVKGSRTRDAGKDEEPDEEEGGGEEDEAGGA